jgi:hypothetical protein
VSVPLSGSVGGIPGTGAALESQKVTEFISTELVWCRPAPVKRAWAAARNVGHGF